MLSETENIKLKALADVLVGVLVRRLISDREHGRANTTSRSISTGNQSEYKKTPGPFGDSPGRSDVLHEQLSNTADFNTAVSMRSLPEGKTGDQNLTD